MALTATKFTGSGAGSSEFRGSWDVSGAGGAETVTITHGLNFKTLSPAAGGNGATPTTIPQATNVWIVPTNQAGADAAFFYVSSITDTTVVIGAKAAGACRVFIERAPVYGV